MDLDNAGKAQVGLAVGLPRAGTSHPISPLRCCFLPGAVYPQPQRAPERGFLLTFPERTWAACWLAWRQSCLYWFLQRKWSHGQVSEVGGQNDFGHTAIHQPRGQEQT